ncbi:MAG: phosphoglucosamine mutase [Fimbriimonadaceae bacterium]|nr:phosphoglucosamine mutase [Fimbriimonadaceae bacterium]QYK58871.1 MAG: phosphoglucosamine mutase [Fimbriimonadaceae bacterium]
MSRLFGTDGVRGLANERVTPELAFKIGAVAGRRLIERGQGAHALVGRDTRRSGPMLGAAVASGLCSAGVSVQTLGTVPTGCVSWAVRSSAASLGVVVSASHNPAPDNGIKLIAQDGRKLPADEERWIEERLDEPHAARPTGADVGWLESDSQLTEAYLQWLLGHAPEGLVGMRIAVDAGNGAAFRLGPELFRRLGAEVVAIGDQPNGTNINAEGGATKPQTVQELTKAGGFDVGVAFDGDADRAVFADSEGRLINGDRTMALWCAHWRQEGRLQPPIVVGTVMSNGGFEAYMARQGVRLERTEVGDKHVSAALDQLGAKIGGEQSGHIIFPESLPTGDGLLTALEVFRVLKREGQPASRFFGEFDSWPQLLVNVGVSSKEGWSGQPQVQDALSRAEERLKGHGRVNVRPSGTQPMIRVMVEAEEVGLRDSVAADIVEALQSSLDGKIYSQVDLTHALGD